MFCTKIIKIHLQKISRIIVYKHYVTDDGLNSKLITGYFESLKEFWTIFVHRFSYKVFERAEITGWQHCNADNFRTL